MSSQVVKCSCCGMPPFSRGSCYKCVKCPDYILCQACYQKKSTSLNHIASHPMQCVPSKSFLRILYEGEVPLPNFVESFVCPYCPQTGFNPDDLFIHVDNLHSDRISEMILCPLCLSKHYSFRTPTQNLANHICTSHPEMMEWSSDNSGVIDTVGLDPRSIFSGSIPGSGHGSSDVQRVRVHAPVFKPSEDFSDQYPVMSRHMPAGTIRIAAIPTSQSLPQSIRRENNSSQQQRDPPASQQARTRRPAGYEIEPVSYASIASSSSTSFGPPTPVVTSSEPQKPAADVVPKMKHNFLLSSREIHPRCPAESNKAEVAVFVQELFADAVAESTESE